MDRHLWVCCSSVIVCYVCDCVLCLWLCYVCDCVLHLWGCCLSVIVGYVCDCGLCLWLCFVSVIVGYVCEFVCCDVVMCFRSNWGTVSARLCSMMLRWPVVLPCVTTRLSHTLLPNCKRSGGNLALRYTISVLCLAFVSADKGIYINCW